MLAYEQVALKCNNIDKQIAHWAEMGQEEWVRDTVDAVHIFLDPMVQKEMELNGPAESFQVRLAFNYHILEGLEFELLEHVTGQTWQLGPHLKGPISHFGYHVPDPEEGQLNTGADSLLQELIRLSGRGMKVKQISQTVVHSNTPRRYRYAFVSGNKTGGVPVKVIQRITKDASKRFDAEKMLKAGREMFACLLSL